MSPAKGQSPLLAEDSTIQQWSEGKGVLQSWMLEDGRWHCTTVMSILLEEGGGGEAGFGCRLELGVDDHLSVMVFEEGGQLCL